MSPAKQVQLAGRPIMWLSVLLLACVARPCRCQSTGPINQWPLESTHRHHQSSALVRHELKFQHQLENVTFIKRPSEQQIFKCQVRLAPLSQQQAAGPGPGPSCDWSLVPLADNDPWLARYLELTARSPSASNNNKWPAQPFDVQLTIDWLKDGQPIGRLHQYEHAIQLINVTLKSGGQHRQAQFDKSARNKTRIEIKNTHNGGQLKLTSRLRMNRLTGNDSGEYRCLARVSFKQMRLELQQQPALVLVNQSLGSHGARLLVVGQVGDKMAQEAAIHNGEPGAGGSAGPLATIGPTNNDSSPPPSQPSAGDKHYHQHHRHHQQQQPPGPGQAMVQQTDPLLGNRDKLAQNRSRDDNNNNNTTDSGQASMPDTAAGGPDKSLSLSGGGPGTAGNNNDYGPEDSNKVQNNQFEDDEDLYGLDLRIISDQGRRGSGLGAAIASDVSGSPDGAGTSADDEMFQPANDNQHIEGHPLADDPSLAETPARVQNFAATKPRARAGAAVPMGPGANLVGDNGDDVGGHIQWEDDLGVAPSEYDNTTATTSAGGPIGANTTGDEITSPVPTSGGGLGVRDNESSLGRQANEHNAPDASYLDPKIYPGSANTTGISNNNGPNNAPANSATASPAPGSDPEGSPRHQHHQRRNHRQKHSRSQSRAGQGSIDHNNQDQSPTKAPVSTKQKLARLVHGMAPTELSFCYTSLGEEYRGSVATSLDQRPCLNWLNIRLFRFVQVALGGPNEAHSGDNSSRLQGVGQLEQPALHWAGLAHMSNENHNHCRNFNSDPLGPWCFVAFDEALDGSTLEGMAISKPRTSEPTALGAMVATGPRGPHQEQSMAPSRSPMLIAPSLGPTNGRRQLYIARQCNISPCSDYLWLYIVAPPIGLLLLLTCILGTFIRSMRKAHRDAVFSTASTDQETADASVINHQRLVCEETAVWRAGKPDMSRECKRAQQRKSNGGHGGRAPGLGGLIGLMAGGGKFVGLQRRKKGAGGQHKRHFPYNDDDVYDIVDDIDFSDGQQTQSSSLSPKSGESFKLNSGSSFSSSGSQMESLMTATTTTTSGKRLNTGPPHEHYYYHHHQPAAKRSTTTTSIVQQQHHQQGDPLKAKLAHCRSINPIFDEKALGEPDDNREVANNSDARRHLQSRQQTQHQRVAGAGGGPMFATLRCPVRATKQSAPNASSRPLLHQQTQLLVNKSSSFIIDKREQFFDYAQNQAAGCDKTATGAGQDLRTDHEQHQPSVWAKGRNGTSNCNLNKQTTGSLSASKSSGKLISCLSSNQGSAVTLDEGSAENSNNPTIIARELQQISPASVTIAYDRQPLYEGKFSQVQVAYLKQQPDDTTQATGLIGAQVAICSLKPQSALDEDIFGLESLKLLSLNHLNLIKLIGRVDLEPEERQTNQRSDARPIGLVYDMAHLIDLSDWLKEQNRDSIIGGNSTQSDSSLRQNLTCFAKQIALALDYLHDKNIVFKDLACRNCFIDVTKMLIKLASFNIELEVDQTDSQKLSLKSMIRPKYLLDYYVIDSRPSEGQLLPLSWIPLESILFNKFNEQTDIWSFGCLLYELFSLGEVAYFGYSSKQVIDSIRSNLMPPKPLLCPNGIYKIICKCLSDIPTLRPNVKQIYEQLNLYGGQCSSFLDHHLCSLA